jgi:hypothetical protein
MLNTLQDFRNLNTNILNRLCYMAELFPTIFNEKLCEQLLQLLKKWLDAAILGYKQQQQGVLKSGLGGGGHQQLKVAAAIIRLQQVCSTHLYKEQ